MKKICFFALGTLLSISHAQLIVSEKIYQQMEARESPRVLMKSQKAVSQDSYIYTIAGSRDFKSGKNFQVKKLEDFHRFTINKKKKKRPLASEDVMRIRAMDDIKAILPKDVADSCAITSVGYDYLIIDSSEPRIVGSTIMVHRKLDGLPVRSDSYILVNYDSTGNMSYMDVRWEKYNKVSAASTIDLSKRSKIHRQEFNDMVESISKNLKEKKLRGSLDNSVQTLASFKNEKGEVMLFPSVTFIGQYSTTDSDESIPMTFDIPSDASLVPNNKAIVSR